MSVEIVHHEMPFVVDPERGVVGNRETGELVSLDDCNDGMLAAIDEALRIQDDFNRTARAAVEDRLKARMKEQRTKLLDTGRHLVELEKKREWDKTLTWAALTGLVEAGVISEAEADEAMPNKTERKPDGRKLNALLTELVAENPEVAQPLARARSERSYIKLVAASVEGSVDE